VALRPMTEREVAAAEYEVLGLSPTLHVLQFLRPKLGEGIVSSPHLSRLPDGSRVHMAGLVVCRQRPATAKGVVFLTLEDEWGLANVIIRPPVYERDRQAVRTAPLVLVEGLLQRRDGVINIHAERVRVLAGGDREPMPRARSFH
jgi:error-prone DNA polymerase